MSKLHEKVDVISRAEVWLDYISQLNPDEFVGAARDLKIKDFRLNHDLQLFLIAWAKADPKGALNYVNEQVKPRDGLQLCHELIMRGWAQRDPQAAITWTDSQTPDSDTLAALIQGMAIHDPEMASDYIEKISDDKVRQSVMASIVEMVAKNGTEALKAWHAKHGFKDGEQIPTATHLVAARMATEDPAAAAQWLETIDRNKSNVSAAREVASQWSRQDLDAAMRWVDGMEGNRKDAAVDAVIYHGVLQNPKMIAGWLNQMKGQARYEWLISRFIDAAQIEHPELAISKVEEISGKSQREVHYSNIHHYWKMRDPEAADAWWKNR